MIKIATIEDEENIRQEIVRYIKKGIGSIEGVEVDVYESAERYLLVGGRYDLVISDIELPGISGLELGKRIKENNPDVYLVFLTSHSEFASESYIIEAYQYILKKDIEERLSPLIERVVHEIKKDYEEYRWVGTNQRKIKIYHKDIVCIQKIKGSKYAEYITENGKYMERLSMNQILEQIHSNAFILVDRGHAVNVKTIQKIETYLYNSHDQSFRYRIYSPEIELRNNTIKVMTSLQAINKVALLFMAVFLTGMIAIYQLRFEHREESYGISLAYGAQYKELYWEIFCEILLLNSIGTIIGIVIGYLVTYYVDFGIMISVVNVQGSWYTFLSAYGLCVVLSSFVSVITFRKLKKKKIIELLNVY